jgi:hypothetical protein
MPVFVGFNNVPFRAETVMTTDPNTAVYTVIGSLLGLRQCASLSHTSRPPKSVCPTTLDEFVRYLNDARLMAANEMIERQREASV